MNPMLNIAIRAARRAGNVIAKNYERRDDIQTSKKGINDYVTSVDKAAEAEIIEIIQKSYPDQPDDVEQAAMVKGIYPYVSPSEGMSEDMIIQAWFKKGLPLLKALIVMS